jgi:hypothetical protein
MPEASHVHKLINRIAKEREEHETEWRQAFLMEREGAAQSFSVSVRLKDGRDADGFPTSLYVRHKWIDQGSKTERLVWLFSNGGIYVEGQHLRRGLDALEEGKLKRIQEQDSSEVALIESHNADIRKPEDKEPIISRVVVSPGFESVLESDENLAEIARVIKEDYVHNGGRGKEPVR